ncbi:hypothetical protein ASG35_12170 [Burkholderia sp. Leaf177]|uniref:hypothetical protein n=1 Tax=Burkholderia sp. Leaf177 TaxID=1736287 RepID=UPI0006F8FCA9|nr:hypothetical protein [Burkholderia sp. Leaf177]KQR77024.1 hypothetical protein ASG35_12170 [Burkholderia sp. Leaf177]
MAYSCSDFTDDVLNTLIGLGLVDRDAIADNDPQAQAEVALKAIVEQARRSAHADRILDGAGKDVPRGLSLP